jgi:hypothetical protein
MHGPEVSTDNNVVAWLILGYLCSYPDARDTVESIGQWWLRGEGVEVDTEMVSGSLAYLMKRGWVTTTEGYAGRALYGLNKSCKYRLQQFIQSKSSGL